MQKAALLAADSRQAVRRGLSQEGERLLTLKGRLFLLAVGKAAAAMASAAEEALGGSIESGLAVTKYGHGVKGLRRTYVLESGHPRPDEAGLRASRQAGAFLRDNQLGQEDLLLLLLSGGGSALLPAPAEGLSLKEKSQAIDLLMTRGADIHQLNAVRKHLSRVKGGRLLDDCSQCQVLALLISDVVGDDLTSIASGPAVPDPTTYGDCLSIIGSHGLNEQMPPMVMSILEEGAKGLRKETPKPGDPRFQRVTSRIVADNRRSLEAAAEAARAAGYRPLILTSTLDGDTAQAARFHVAVAREVLESANPAEAPCCILSGGETTVKVSGDGRGGRNQEFALWCAHYAGGLNREVLFVSLGTDGTDGPTDAAGAWSFPSTCAQARERGLDCGAYLRRNDSYRFFKQLDQLIVTGPTQTNVMDVRAVLVPPS